MQQTGSSAKGPTAARRAGREEHERPRGPSARDTAVHRVFRGRAEAAPEAPAVVDGDRTLSYGQLLERARSVAAALSGAGVGPGSIVPVCVDRSADLCVALLGVLEAGAAYLPLDPAYPAARLELMLADAGTSCALLSERHLKSLPLPEGAQPVVLERALRAPPAPGPGAGASVGPDDPAYVMYTSGSTGRPKGVLVPHRGILRLVLDTDYASFGAQETWLQLAPASFDASTLEIWAPLLHGGRCVVHPEAVPTAAGLREAIERHGVTSAWLTASLFNAIVDSDVGALRGLRQLLIGGEALSVRHVRAAFEALPGTRLVNGYGPTENTTFTCCHTIRREDLDSGRPIPIGRAIPHTAIEVVDPALRPVPDGEAGELLAAGDGVALGYLARPELTQDRFLPDPARPGRLRYRTGDRVRRGPDGVVEFLGRLDEQVKVRGHRIEPGEIEAAIRLVPGVADAVVVARDDAPSGRCLVGYFVTSGSGPTAEEVEARLRHALPSFMVPSFLVPLDRLPLNPNGKLDRAALPPPARARRSPGAGPADARARAVAAAFEAVLGSGPVDPDDDFLALGGDSLAAVRVAARCERDLGAQPSVADVLEARTPRALAQRLSRVAPPPAGESVGSAAPFPAAPGQAAMWFDLQAWPDTPLYDETLAIRLRGPLDVLRLAGALRTVTARHAALGFRLVSDAHGPLVAPGPAPAVELDVREVLPDGLDAALRAEARRPIDVTRGPLLRATLFQTAPDDSVLVLGFHHLALDDWSIEILLREVEQAWTGAQLPHRPSRYADFAARTARGVESALPAWAAALAGARVPDLGDRRADRGGRAAPEADEIAAELPQDLVEALRHVARHRGATPFAVHLAAFGAVVAETTGDRDVLVASPYTLRGSGPWSDEVGYFLHLLPLRLSLGGASTLGDAVDRARETSLAAQRRAGAPLHRALAAAGVLRELGNGPACPPVFVHRTRPKETLEVPGLRSSPVRIPAQVAKFDLALFVDETDAGGRVAVVHRRSHVSAARARGILERYVETLRRLAAEPATCLAIPAEPRPREPVALRARAPAARGDEVERELAAIWRDLLGISRVEPTDDFFALGGHSLVAVRLFGAIERRFGRSLPVRAIFENPTLAGLAEAVRGRTVSRLPPAIVALRQGGSGTPLFCLPGVGGHVFMYRRVAELLPPGYPVYALQIQELDAAGVALESIEGLARSFVAQIRSVVPEGRIRLAGYSFGAVVAYEMARQFAGAEPAVESVVLLDAFAPGAVERRSLLERTWLHLRTMADLGPRGAAGYLAARVRRRRAQLALGARRLTTDSPEHLPLELRVEEVRRRCLRALEAYAAPPYAGTASVSLVRAARASKWFRARGIDPSHGWGALVPRPVHVTDIFCEHLELFRSPYVERLAEALGRRLAETAPPVPAVATA